MFDDHVVTEEIALPVVDNRGPWLSYDPMIRRIADDRTRRMAEVRPLPVPIIAVTEQEIEQVATSLNFPAAEYPTVSIVVPVFKNLRLTLGVPTLDWPLYRCPRLV